MVLEASVYHSREGGVEHTRSWWQGYKAEGIHVSTRKEREKPELQASCNFQKPTPVALSYQLDPAS